jgi:hypothetical protein
MMQSPNLTTLARVKSWLGITTEDSDAALLGLIQAVSVFIYDYIDIQTVAVTSYSELRDSQGHNWIRPNNWPLISLESVLYGGITVNTESSGNPAGPGFLINYPNRNIGRARITIQGYQPFPFGKNCVTINYTAGFQQVDDRIIIPIYNDEDPPVAVSGTVLLSQLWAADGGVIDTNTEVPYTLVSASPAAGEYTVSELGVYGFNVDDVGQPVTITYSYVPADLAQAATELVGATFQSAQHIGVKSKSLGGQETVAYFQNQLTPSMKMMLQPYMKVTPS